MDQFRIPVFDEFGMRFNYNVKRNNTMNYIIITIYIILSDDYDEYNNYNYNNVDKNNNNYNDNNNNNNNNNSNNSNYIANNNDIDINDKCILINLIIVMIFVFQP